MFVDRLTICGGDIKFKEDGKSGDEYMKEKRKKNKAK